MWEENELSALLTKVVDDPEMALLKKTLQEKEAEIIALKRALQLSVPITALVPLYRRYPDFPYKMEEKEFHAWQNRELWKENTYLHAFMRQMGVVL